MYRFSLLIIVNTFFSTISIAQEENNASGERSSPVGRRFSRLSMGAEGAEAGALPSTAVVSAGAGGGDASLTSDDAKPTRLSIFLGILARGEEPTDGERFSGLDKLDEKHLRWVEELLNSGEEDDAHRDSEGDSDSKSSDVEVSDEDDDDHHRDVEGLKILEAKVKELSKDEKLALKRAVRDRKAQARALKRLEEEKRHKEKVAKRKEAKRKKQEERLAAAASAAAEKAAIEAAAPKVRVVALTAIERNRREAECREAIAKARSSLKVGTIPKGREALKEQLQAKLHEKDPRRNPKPKTTRVESAGSGAADFMSAVLYSVLSGGTATVHPDGGGVALERAPTDPLVQAALNYLALSGKEDKDVLEYLLRNYEDAKGPAAHSKK